MSKPAEQLVVIDCPRHPGAGDTRSGSRRQLGELSEHGSKHRFEFIELGTEHVLGRLIHSTATTGVHQQGASVLRVHTSCRFCGP